MPSRRPPTWPAVISSHSWGLLKTYAVRTPASGSGLAVDAQASGKYSSPSAPTLRTLWSQSLLSRASLHLQAMRYTTSRSEARGCFIVSVPTTCTCRCHASWYASMLHDIVLLTYRLQARAQVALLKEPLQAQA